MAEPRTKPFSPKFQSKPLWTGKPGNIVFPLSTGSENLPPLQKFYKSIKDDKFIFLDLSSLSLIYLIMHQTY